MAWLARLQPPKTSPPLLPCSPPTQPWRLSTRSCSKFTRRQRSAATHPPVVPRRKRKKGVQKIVRQYGTPILGGLLFIAFCAAVALQVSE